MGNVVSLVWALELVVEPGGIGFKRDLALAPEGRIILLSAVSGAATIG
jgi:hypothetical protein